MSLLFKDTFIFFYLFSCRTKEKARLTNDSVIQGIRSTAVMGILGR